MKKPTRRQLLLSSIAVPLACGLPAFAQTGDYPARPIRLIVPFGPGTSTDTVTRVLADAMGRGLGQPLLVENRAGGGGTIGTDLAAHAPADGYTLVMGTVGTHAINKSLYRKLSYDPVKDFAPIALVGQTPTLLVVGAGSPLRSLQDLAAAAKKNPGLSFASAGSGTSGHLAGELLKQRLGGEMVHVPYKEGGLALSDVMSGQVDFMFYHPAAVLPQIRAGKLRALGASGAQRSAAAPAVATVAEQIGGGFDLVAWFMLYAPSATPAPALARLRAAAAKALSDADVQEKLQAQGVEAAPVRPTELAAFSQRELGKWADLVRLSGAQVD